MVIKNILLKLILPVIFPSWRFFSSIGASPRIQFAFLQNKIDEPTIWQEFRPLPASITFTEALSRLFWNREWNETLYMNTCAERLFDEYSLMREQEIMTRILATVHAGKIKPEPNSNFMLFRISAICRENHAVTQSVVFISQPVELSGSKL